MDATVAPQTPKKRQLQQIRPSKKERLSPYSDPYVTFFIHCLY